ncbi:hypothetical protein PG913_08650 [Tenacibaculum pacificus]|uniref:hypothetical protein n=1 Tax=Tenacibaculum pacificus TaxID=3018314 RepID=UPI0022F3B54A|nr:hypothetical protein [Tenacibaculum pacificus]WBX72965.1 hypothetical protein PG913_08650 [Tenacibaculum pacificus]
MITIGVLLILLGNIVLYNTSKKVELYSNTTVERWIQQHTNYSQIIGCLLLISALPFICYSIGITSGLIFWLVTLMLFLSLVVVISPLKIVNYKHLAIVFLILIIIEYTL